jgi:hypothetical protein
MIILYISGLRESGESYRISVLSDHNYIQELLNGYSHRFKEVTRMNHDIFHSIYGDLHEIDLEDTLGVTIEEVFLIFLFIIDDIMGNRII